MQVIDGKGVVMGRLASHVAKRLLEGEEIHVINCELILISGKRQSIMNRFKFKREVGSTRKGPFYPRMPHKMFKRTVRGMLNYQQPRGRDAYKRLKTHIGSPKELSKEKSEVIEDAKPKGGISYVELGRVSKDLGAKFG